MTDLPRRPIRPLQPPPGSFEQTVARARSRRRRALVGASCAGLAVVAVVAIVGATSLGHVGAQRDVHQVLPIASSPPPSSPPPSSAPPSSAPPSSAPPSSAPPSSAPPSSALPSTTAPVVASTPVSPPVVVSSPPPSAPVSALPPMYHGRLTDAAHHPLRGYYLYWDSAGLDTAGNPPDELSVDQPAATTRTDGTFDVPCGTPLSPFLAISAMQLAPDAHSTRVSPADSQHQPEVDVTYTGANSFLPTVDVRHGCEASAPRHTTIYRPGAVVTGTLSIDGKPYSAADATRAATAQPGEPGSDLSLFVEYNSANGETLMDGILPQPGTGAFRLSGLGTGDVAFGVANFNAKVPVVDGQSVKVAVAVTTGSSPTGGDATVSVTVVP